MYKLNDIRQIHLEITQKCQAACTMCDRNINGGEINPHLGCGGVLDELTLEDIKKDIRSSGEREIPSRLIGEVVMQNLRKIDEVAFIRFASVYRRFEDINEFSEEVEKLTSD